MVSKNIQTIPEIYIRHEVNKNKNYLFRTTNIYIELQYKHEVRDKDKQLQTFISNNNTNIKGRKKTKQRNGMDLNWKTWNLSCQNPPGLELW